jgi:hypothetical protein
VCVALEVLVLTGQDWFAGPLGIGGALAVPIITGLFPMLLIVAAHRKGEYVPASVVRLFGHPVVVVTLITLFVVVVAVHGLFIWEGALERVAAIVVALAMVAVALWSWRRRAFRRRAVVELRRDRRTDRTTVSVKAAGRSVLFEAAVDGVDGVGGEHASAVVPAGPWHELRIWPHEVSSDGWSSRLAADVAIDRQPVAGSRGNWDIVVPTDGAAMTVQFILPEATGA